MPNIRDILLMDENPTRDKLLEEYNNENNKNIKIRTSEHYTSRPIKTFERFSDDIKPIRIKAHPLERDKSEADITRDHEILFRKLGILYFHTKVKGEFHLIGKGQAILKKSQNKGFFDMILLIKGKTFVGLELKSGNGGVWSLEQIQMHNSILNAGGYAIVSNSVHITKSYLKEKGLI